MGAQRHGPECDKAVVEPLMSLRQQPVRCYSLQGIREIQVQPREQKP